MKSKKAKSKKAPAWFLVVTRSGFEVGPTVPFVLGAIQTPIGARPESAESAKKELADLIESMRDSGYGVSIQDCKDVVRDLVVTSNGLNSLLWEPVDGCKMPDCDGLIEVLWARYGKYIVEGEYSIDDGIFREFNASEIAKIKKALQVRRGIKNARTPAGRR